MGCFRSMRTAGFGSAVILFGLALSLFLGSVLSPRLALAEPVAVTTSILPLGDFARQVGGENVVVTVLVPPGQNPHILNFKPSDLHGLSRARLLLLNGLGLEFWAKKLVEAVQNPQLVVLQCAESWADQMEKEEGHGMSQSQGKGGHDPHGDHGHEEHGGVDPHVWLDPVAAMTLVACVRDGLVRVDPDHAAEYRQRAEKYLTQLKTLHHDFERTLSKARQRTFISFHEGYGHLARRYNLRGLGVVEGFSELEPSPARLAKVIREVRRLKAKVIFAEPQFSAKSATTIAQETGARVAFLDPLGQSAEDGYLKMMRRNLTELQKALVD